MTESSQSAAPTTEAPGGNPNYYWAYQVRHRSGKLVSWRRFFLMLIAAGAAVFWLPRNVNSDLKLADLATAVLTFATISFGACLTGAVLALTIPSDTQRHELAAHRVRPGAPFSSFSDLVFTFTWSAMSQLPLVLVALAAYIVGGTVHASHDLGSHVPERVVLGLMAAFGVNAFGQLTTVVKTISQLAHVGPLLESLPKSKDQGTTSN